VEAALKAARASAIAGFSATSNTAAARRYGLRATGTMAHSYVQAFPSETEAFAAFAADFPERVTFLVDTYDTLTGVSRAIEVIRQRRLAGQLAIRLDSGDLLELSVASRGLLDEAGLPKVRIVASGNLDEYEIERLVRRSAPIDAYGVGTRMGVSADAPYLDSVYKLVAYDERPVMKLSPGKATQPGAKQVYRTAVPKSIGPDLLASEHERAPSGMEPLLAPVMEGVASTRQWSRSPPRARAWRRTCGVCLHTPCGLRGRRRWRWRSRRRCGCSPLAFDRASTDGKDERRRRR
jgi:nicotinate phosphoribosyltransferase